MMWPVGSVTSLKTSIPWRRDRTNGASRPSQHWLARTVSADGLDSGAQFRVEIDRFRHFWTEFSDFGTVRPRVQTPGPRPISEFGFVVLRLNSARIRGLTLSAVRD